MKIALYMLLLFSFISLHSFAQNQMNYAYPGRLQTKIWNKAGFGGVTRIKVSWTNPSSSTEYQKNLVINAVANTWEKESGIIFDWVEDVNNADGIRIFVEDDTPHTIHLGRENSGLYKGMVLNFTFRNWAPAILSSKGIDFCIKAVAVHEFGHAIGFAHEQNRKDCPFCDLKPQGEDGDFTIGQCDIHSVMNYCNPEWNNNGFLSDGDIYAVQLLYGTPDLKQKSIKQSQNMKSIVSVQKDNGLTVKVYWEGEDYLNRKITQVIYKLDNRFTPNIVSKQNNIDLIVTMSHGFNFKIKAIVYYNDGEIDSTRYVNIEFFKSNQDNHNYCHIKNIVNNGFLNMHWVNIDFQTDKESSKGAKWILTRYSTNNLWRLKNVWTNSFLDIDYNNNFVCVNKDTKRDIKDSSTEFWNFEQENNVFVIKNPYKNITLQDKDGNRKWVFKKIEKEEAGHYYICDANNSNRYLTAENERIQCNNCDTAWPSGKWVLEKMGDNNYFRIRNVKNNTYLNIENGDVQASNILAGWHSAIWYFQRDSISNSYYIRNLWTNGYLNIKAGYLECTNQGNEMDSYTSKWQIVFN